jgi:hypothetical protein
MKVRGLFKAPFYILNRINLFKDTTDHYKSGITKSGISFIIGAGNALSKENAT